MLVHRLQKLSGKFQVISSCESYQLQDCNVRITGEHKDFIDVFNIKYIFENFLIGFLADDKQCFV